jgi:hypothetical protein
MAVTAFQVAALCVLIFTIAAVVVFPPLVFVAIGLALAYFLVPMEGGKKKLKAAEEPLRVSGFNQPAKFREDTRPMIPPRPDAYLGEDPHHEPVVAANIEHPMLSGGLILSPEQMRSVCAGLNDIRKRDCMNRFRMLRPGNGGKTLSKADVDRVNAGRRELTRRARTHMRDDGYTVRIRKDGAPPPPQPKLSTVVQDPLFKRRAQLRNYRTVEPFGDKVRSLPPL